MRMRLSYGLVWVLCAVISTACSVAQADLVIFELGNKLDNTTIDGMASGSLTRDGLTATLTANVGVFSANMSGFGINADGSDDAPSLLDGGSGTSEFITITFDQPVTFTQLTLASFSGSERASLTVGPNPARILDATTAGTDVYDFTSGDFPIGNMIDIGQTLVIGYAFGSADDNGFSLEGFHVNTVPEPSSLGCVLPMLICSVLRRKRSG